MKTFRKKLLEKSPAKAQSAMEYLMTYGWAILIIAVVLGALFELGVFNANNFAPKAPPGSCQVFRPNGPGTTSFINLEGVCSGELPQYVGTFIGCSGCGSTTLSWINAANPYMASTTSLTISVWLYTPTSVPCDQPLFTSLFNVYAPRGANLDLIHMVPYFNTGNSTADFAFSGASSIIAGSWANIVATASHGNGNIYVNGALSSTGPTANTIQYNSIDTSFAIGLDNATFGCPARYSHFNGTISNVQIYNTSLSANEVQALYLEGIGGAPINLQHLVGWWPLNGNANDYSGNGNNGVPTNVMFVSNWWSSYTPP